ncbi:PG0870-related protein [Taibaiella soli]|uniref:Zinc beta-ribbon finger putative domain-containing protein n=1 Tax=Taibaiella soli TaxID=1649169 RepID=A0A2W2B3S2_9BACT|nr:PG0870-related protein [Taibaiella soli]PZF74678.1 hypothetical protein DN068_00325 [Taibaiella soli]
MAYTYTLDNRKPHKKFKCPNCGEQKSFVRYIDRTTDNYLPEQYGKCDREINCGYHNNPYKDGYAKENMKPLHDKYILKRPIPPIPPTFINNDLFFGTLRHHD